jgi:hypothetical protein
MDGDILTPDPYPDDPWSWTREAFRWVEDAPGYFVGSLGNVWSCWHRRRTGFHPTDGTTGWVFYTGRPYLRMKPLRIRSGLLVPFRQEGRPRIRKLVHRLVLETFVGPCPPDMQGCHNNGDFTDNRLDNLRWDTCKANMADKRRHGTMARGSRIGTSKLIQADVDEIRRLSAEGKTNAWIGKAFGVRDCHVGRIVRRVCWAESPIQSASHPDWLDGEMAGATACREGGR